MMVIDVSVTADRKSYTLIPQNIDTWSRSVRNKKVKLYEFALKGRHFVSAVRIREGPYYRGFF